MAWTASGLYVATFRDALNGTIALDLDLLTHKLALYNNTDTPNYAGNGETGYAVTNEVTGTNWAAGGVALAGTVLDDHNGTVANQGQLRFDANDISVSNATFSNAYGCKIYADALVGNNLICGVYFGGSAYSPNAGTFSITWGSAGIFNLDFTP